MARSLTLRERFHRKAPRTVKFVRRWFRAAREGRPTPRAVFVVGSQRSGTRLPLMVMDRSPEIMTYNEGSSPFFDRVLLKDNITLHRELRKLPFPIVVLKPICESHRTLELLQAFPGAKAVWIYRDYRDAVNSAVLKWKSGPTHVRELATGDLAAAGWRAGGLSEAKLALVRQLYREDISPHAADAIMWYLRNGLYFDLGLDARPDVQLVRYEDLVTDPQQHFPALFEFLGCPFEGHFLRDVYSSSVRSKPFPVIPPAIASLCDDLLRELNSHYESIRSARETPSGPRAAALQH